MQCRLYLPTFSPSQQKFIAWLQTKKINKKNHWKNVFLWLVSTKNISNLPSLSVVINSDAAVAKVVPVMPRQPRALSQNGEKRSDAISEFSWQLSNWKMDYFLLSWKSQRRPPSHLHFWTNTQFTSVTKPTTDLFPFCDPWEIISSSRGLICCDLEDSYKETLEASAVILLLIKSGATFFDTRLQSQRKGANSWGVALTWLRLDGILARWIWFWLQRLRPDSVPAVPVGPRLYRDED